MLFEHSLNDPLDNSNQINDLASVDDRTHAAGFRP